MLRISALLFAALVVRGVRPAVGCIARLGEFRGNVAIVRLRGLLATASDPHVRHVALVIFGSSLSPPVHSASKFFISAPSCQYGLYADPF